MSAPFKSVAQARLLARKKLPPAVYHYVDGGKEAEVSAHLNEVAFNRILFSPKVCAGIRETDISVNLLGKKTSMPLIVAPTGFIRIVHADGEIGAARAAAAAGVPIAISTFCGEPAGAIADVNPDTWFQLYMIGGRSGAERSIRLAREAGCRVLVVTVDVVAITPIDRISRPLPMKVDFQSALGFLPEVWNRPGWLLRLMRGGLDMRAPNAPPAEDGRLMHLGEAGGLLTATPPDWEDLKWIRDQWQGPMVVKGVLRADDAVRAAAIGADAVSVSNHGGKVMDGAPSAVSVLPEIVDAAGGRLDVLLDGGVRRGADVVRACALGAKGVMIGRPYLWGLAAKGERGVLDILNLFERGIYSTLRQIGCPSFDRLDKTYLRPLPDQADWNRLGSDYAAP